MGHSADTFTAIAQIEIRHLRGIIGNIGPRCRRPAVFGQELIIRMLAVERCKRPRIRYLPCAALIRGRDQRIEGGPFFAIFTLLTGFMTCFGRQ